MYALNLKQSRAKDNTILKESMNLKYLKPRQSKSLGEGAFGIVTGFMTGLVTCNNPYDWPCDLLCEHPCDWPCDWLCDWPCDQHYDCPCDWLCDQPSRWLFSGLVTGPVTGFVTSLVIEYQNYLTDSGMIYELNI